MFLSNSIRILGILNIGLLLNPFIYKKIGFKRVIFGAFFGLLPHFLWLFRNFHYLNVNHFEHYQSQAENFIFINNGLNLWRSLSFSLAGESVILFLTLLSLFVILIYITISKKWKFIQNKKEYLGYQVVVWTLFTQIMGFSLICAFTESTNLIKPDTEQLRILSFLYLVIFISMFSGLSKIFAKRNYFCNAAIITLLALYCIYLTDFRFRDPYLGLPASINSPPEKELWEKIGSYKYASNSDYFYSDLNFIHQVFSRRKQVILWGNIVGNPPIISRISELLELQDVPFILVNGTSTEFLAPLDEMVKMGKLKSEIIEVKKNQKLPINCFRSTVMCKRYEPGNAEKYYLYFPHGKL